MILVLGLTFASIFGGIAYADLNYGLIAYYPFNGNGNDASGNGNDGTVYGASLTEDRFGEPNAAYSFDGVDDVVTVPNSPSLNLGTSDFSLTAWIRTSDQRDDVNQGIIAKRDSSSAGAPGYTLGVAYPGGPISAMIMDDGSGGKIKIHGVTPMGDGLWHFVVFIADRDGYGRIYTDGQPDGNPVSISLRSGSVNNSLPLYVGKYYSSFLDDYYFLGQIDDARIHNRILSEPEIQELYEMVPEDTTPPSVSATVIMDHLWPPNHKMVDVGFSFEVSDLRDPDPNVFIEVTSDEPTVTWPYVLGHVFTPDAAFSDDGKLFLRAERSWKGDGRVYEITITAIDASGNSDSSSVLVRVNRNKGQEAMDSGQDYYATTINYLR